MTVMKKLLIALLCGATVCAPVMADNCDNPTYRRYNPDKCTTSDETESKLSLSGTIAIASGTAALIGGGLALFGLSSSDAGSSTSPAVATTTTHPTLHAYTMVGGDVTTAQLSSVINHTEYTRNTNQYNDIRLAYSLARGYTGKTSTIAVLDAGKNTYHGMNVAYMASGAIAPDATVQSYQVSNQYDEFKSFSEIGDVINSATASGSNIYNFSWSAKNKFATSVRNRQHMIQITDANFVNSLTNAATQNDAIFVWAAGNDYSSQSSALSALPLHIPELDGHFVNVVAWDSSTNSLAEFSNACGITKNYCITAPGTNLDSPKSDTAINGTSFAAPIVSAAIAVIREAFPYMESNQITALLFDTARDLGAVGVDDVYGHGLLDLERATRPVGVALVPLSDGNTIALRTSSVSGSIGHQIKSENITFAFVDSYGRAFETKLNDNIRVRNRGIGFEHLRSDRNQMQLGKLELGFKQTNLLMGDGFLSTSDNNTLSFIGYRNTLTFGHTEIFHHSTLGFINPTVSPESMINGFSNVYTASVEIGAKYNNWTFSIGTPDTIIGGNMHLYTPTGRAIDGQYTYSAHTINLSTRPSVEYSASYKFMRAGFVDNPYGTDEFYIVAKTKVLF